MKRLSIPILISGAIISTACATSMCVHTGSYVVTMSVSKNGVSSSDSGDGTWTATFNYPLSNKVNNNNVMIGGWGCNDTTGSENVADSNLDTSSSDTGVNCWCVLRSPLMSKWVFVHEYGTSAECSAGCAANCGRHAQTSSAFRGAMYNTILQTGD